jgi:hypothetical protein
MNRTAIALTIAALGAAPVLAHDPATSYPHGHEPEKGAGDTYGTVSPMDTGKTPTHEETSHPPYPHTHEAEKGAGDTYGTISPMGMPEVQIIIRGAHVPHPPYPHTHEPEKGAGDSYGTVSPMGGKQ